VGVFGIHPVGLIHIGAHYAEELDEYTSTGLRGKLPIIWVEANPAVAESLSQSLNASGNRIINTAAWDLSGLSLKLNIASSTASSSLLEFGSHAEKYPEITYERQVEVLTSRMEDLLREQDKHDFLVLDIQGAEVNAIKGFGKKLQQVNWIYMEVAKSEIYKGSGTVKDIDELMNHIGFKRVVTFWQRKLGWGDALYIRTDWLAANQRNPLAEKLLILRWNLRNYIPERAFPLLVKMKALVRKLTNK